MGKLESEVSTETMSEIDGPMTMEMASDSGAGVSKWLSCACACAACKKVPDASTNGSLDNCSETGDARGPHENGMVCYDCSCCKRRPVEIPPGNVVLTQS